MIADRDIDALSERVLELLLVDGADAALAARALVGDLAAQRPDAPALFSVLPLSIAAAAIEGMLANGLSRRLAQDTWRVVAMLAAEVLALQVQMPDATAPTVAALWQRLQADPQALGVPGPTPPPEVTGA